jgi:hypothetical protein
MKKIYGPVKEEESVGMKKNREMRYITKDKYFKIYKPTSIKTELSC